MNDVREKIIAIMAVIFEMENSKIPINASPGVVEKWDSLRHMNLITALEEEFGIRFPDDQIEELISIDLIELGIDELAKRVK